MLLCNENGKARNKRFHPTRAIRHAHIYILPLLFYPIELIINGETRASTREKQTNKQTTAHTAHSDEQQYMHSEQSRAESGAKQHSKFPLLLH